MEEVYKIFKTADNKVLIEINQGKFENKTYSLFIANEQPYPVFVGEVVGEDKIEFIKDKALAMKILKELVKDKEINDKFKKVISSIK